MEDKWGTVMELSRDRTMNRWVDQCSARILAWIVIMNRRSQICRTRGSDDSDAETTVMTNKMLYNLPEVLFTVNIPRFLHFDSPYKGMIYIFGGRASKVLEPEYYLDTAECYDTFRNEWIKLPSMSTKRVGGASVAASNGLIYVIGGYSKHPDKPLASGECFNPRTGEWKPIAPMHRSRFGHTAQEFGQFIFVVGGDSRRNLVTEIERYDIESDEWTTVSMLPRPVAGGRILTRDGKLYLVGGDVGSQPLSFTDVIRVYDPIHNSWSSLDEKLSLGRSACAVAWCGEGSSTIAVIGGYAADNDIFFELSSTELIETAQNGEGGLKSIPALPEPRAGCRAVTIGSRIYVIGGESPIAEVPKTASTSNQLEDSILSGLFNAGSQNTAGSLSHMRELLLQALQQRIPSSNMERNVEESNSGQLARFPTPPQTERKPHPKVAVFDTLKWCWETESPIMGIARTAASVCVGPGYCTSYGWNTNRRWVTDSSSSRSRNMDASGARPFAADG